MSTLTHCPWCGGELEEGEHVDVGVGGRGVKVSPDVCTVCSAFELGSLGFGRITQLRNGFVRGDVEREREHVALLLTPLPSFE